jgi:RND superfamily putative drug exporter
MPSTKGITPPHPPADRAPKTREPRDREVDRSEAAGDEPGRETRQGRIRAWTTSALRDLGYASAVFLWSIVAFTVLVTGVSVTASLLVLVIGVFVWVGFAYIVRWTTAVDRRLAGWQRNERVRAVYRRPAAGGFLPLLKTVSSDPQTWRDLAWLGLTSIAGFALGLAAITAAGVVLAYVSMPIWYWAISDAHAKYGVTNLGLFTVDSLGEAFAATAIGLALAPLGLLLARGCATAHAGLAARILSPSTGAELRASTSDRAAAATSVSTPATFTARAARWSAAHRRTAVLGWLALVFIAYAIGSAVGTVTLKSEDQGVGESRAANRVLAREFPRVRAPEEIIIQSRTGRLPTGEYRATVQSLVARLSRLPAVAEIKSPLQRGNEGQVSKDETSALITFQITGDPDTAKDRVGPALTATAAVQAAHPRLFVGEMGEASANKAINQRLKDDFSKAELTSLPLTLLILVVAFGALVAAGIPLLLGITAVAAALGMTALFSHLIHVDQMISSVILLIGLAVAVDYSLFYLRREREERARGRSPDDALQIAAATSGRAVLFSGFVVMTAMAGMFLMGNQTFVSFGVGAILVVAMALVGSLTVLPAILSKLGDRVDRGRIPFLSRVRAKDGESRFWGTIVGVVLRHPLVWGGLATALLVALAIPAFSLHTVESGAQGLPRDLPVMKVYERIQKTFPGGPSPAEVVVQAPDVTTPQVAAGIAALKRAALASGRMHEPITVDVSTSRRAARVNVPLAGKGTDATSNRALDTLRRDVVPATVAKAPGVTAQTTGWTATSRDFNDSMKAHAPLVFAFVLGLAFALLLLTFRSIVIPIKAIVLNLLSVGAAYGVLVLIFQKGNLESLLGFTSIGGVTAWLPLFLFVILFGLSMDYHVLILSRVRESYDSGMRTEDAVAHGIRATASVVTSAAIVMVGVFAIFATLGMIDFKMMGVGLAVAILIDATVVRAVLLPATMKLLGDWNWYLPSWLEWLPRIRREPPVDLPEPPTDAPQPAEEPRVPVAH